MRKIVLVVGATLVICGTAAAASTVYYTGTYAGATSQQQPIKMKIGRAANGGGVMEWMKFLVNGRCVDSHGNLYTDKGHLITLGSAPVRSNQTINTTFSGNGGSTHLAMGLDHQKADGWFKAAWIAYTNSGRKLKCVTPGGQATVAGKVAFAMHHT